MVRGRHRAPAGLRHLLTRSPDLTGLLVAGIAFVVWLWAMLQPPVVQLPMTVAEGVRTVLGAFGCITIGLIARMLVAAEQDGAADEP